MADYSLQDVMSALRKADAAGNVDDARRLAQIADRMRSSQGGSITSQPLPEQGQPGPEAAPQAAPEKTLLQRFTDPIRMGVDQALEGAAQTAKLAGRDETAGWLSGLTEAPENYTGATQRMIKDPSKPWWDPSGYDLNALPEAIAEQSGQFAGAIASRGVGAAAGAGIGAAGGLVGGPAGVVAGAAGGAAAGAFAGPALFEAVQVIGPVAYERAKAQGREEPNSDDVLWALGTGTVSGALNAIAPGASGFIRRIVTEGGTEGLQTLVEQTGTTLNTKQGLTLDGQEAVVGALAGAGSAGVVDTAVGTTKGVAQGVANAAEATGNAVLNIRTDSPENFTEDDIRAAQRLVDAADGDMEILSRVSDKNPENSAQSAAKAALQGARAEAETLINSMMQLAQTRGDTEAINDLKTLRKNIGNMTSRVPDEHINRVSDRFSDTNDGARIGSLARQINRLQRFTTGDGDIGGISGKLLRLADPTDGRNPLISRVFSGMGNLAAMGVPIGLNRLARGVDNLTNQRSQVKRFVQSAQRAGEVPSEIQGRTSSDVLTEIKLQRNLEKIQKGLDAKDAAAREAAQKRSQKEAEDGFTQWRKLAEAQTKTNADRLKQEESYYSQIAAEKAAAEKRSRKAAEDSFSQWRQNAESQKKINAERLKQEEAFYKSQEAEQAKKAKAALKALSEGGSISSDAQDSAAVTAQMFESDEIPNRPYYEPYKRWKEATGLGPKDTLAAIEQLEAEGHPAAPPGTAARFRGDIRSFRTKSKDPKSRQTYDLQEAIVQRVSPDYSPDSDAFGRGGTLDQSNGPRFRDLNMRRDKLKRSEANARYAKLLDMIEDPKVNLTEAQRMSLIELADAINDQELTKDDRKALVASTLPNIFRKKGDVAAWTYRFTPLASIGNNYRIPAGREVTTQDMVEEDKEKATKARAKKKGKAKKTKADFIAAPAAQRPDATGVTPDVPMIGAGNFFGVRNDQPGANDNGRPGAGNPVGTPPNTPLISPNDFMSGNGARSGLYGAANDRPKAPSFPVPTAPKSESSVGPIQGTNAKASRGKGSTSIGNMINDEYNAWVERKRLVQERGAEFDAYYDGLIAEASDPDAVNADVALVKATILTGDTGALNQNMVTESFARDLGISMKDAAKRVDAAMKRLEATGEVKRLVVGRGGATLTSDGKPVKTVDGKKVYAVKVELGGKLGEMAEIAAAASRENRLPDTSKPKDPFTPDNLSNGDFYAFKSYAEDRVDESFKPVLDLVNWLRSNPMVVDRQMVMQTLGGLNEAVKTKRTDRVDEQLLPKKKGLRNKSPMRAFAQILHQIDENNKNFTIFQEWFGGDNLRVYSRNGSASSQGGDMMKGLFRSPVRTPMASKEGVDFILHSFGNLLGYDKDSPAERRAAVFQGDTIDQLLKFADDPFKRDLLTNRAGELTRIGEIVKGGEGFFQVLSVANELKRMVDFAKAKHPSKAKMKPRELLMDPKVRKSLEAYETDFIVQLDANNNSFQLVGLMLGDPTILQATGLQPPPGSNEPADIRRGADVYMTPALAITERIPALKAANLPSKTLRKIFKKPISNFVYASTFSSRRDAFDEAMTEAAESYGFKSVFGLNEGDGLIQIPLDQSKAIESPAGFLFEHPNPEKNRTSRVVKKGDNWTIEDKVVSKNGKETWTPRKSKFENKDDAIIGAYSHAFFRTLDGELLRDLNARYPGLQEFINFNVAVMTEFKRRHKAATEEAAALGLPAPKAPAIKVPTVDGMILDYKFNETTTYDAYNVNVGDKVVRMGLPADDLDPTISGRGLAAFVTHQNDAYVLREAHRRFRERHGELLAFNPIHDSFGFHPSQAAQGQAIVLEVMQELGDAGYNIFEQLLRVNNLDPRSFPMPTRRGITPQKPGDIPTALS